jgi:hypothetical protein
MDGNELDATRAGLQRSDAGSGQSGAGSPVAAEWRRIGDGSSAALGRGRRTARRRREVGDADGSAAARGRGRERLVDGARSWTLDALPAARGRGRRTPRRRRGVADSQAVGGAGSPTRKSQLAWGRGVRRAASTQSAAQGRWKP